MGANPFAAQTSGPRTIEDDYAEADGFIRLKTPAVQFPKVGFRNGGTILSHEFRDDTDQKGNQRFWLGNDPVTAAEAMERHVDPASLEKMRVLLLTVQSHDETLRGRAWKDNTYEPVVIEDDDLVRVAYVRGSLRKAVGQALVDAGVPLKGWLRTAVGAHILWTRGPNAPKRPGAQGAPHTHTAVWTKAADNPHQSVADDPWAKDLAAGAPAEETPF
jgi:hypothetical protein